MNLRVFLDFKTYAGYRFYRKLSFTLLFGKASNHHQDMHTLYSKQALHLH